MTDSSQAADTRGRGHSRRDRGLSDVLGYVLVFSLVLMSVMLVTVGGLATIEDARDAEQAQNAERAFEVVADNFAAIYERNAPSRAAELDLGDSEIFYDSEVSITVRSGDGAELASRELTPVEMRIDDQRRLVYEGGAVFRHSEAGVTMVREPPFMLSADRTHVPIVQTTSETVESAGSTTVLLRGVSTERSVAVAGEDFGQLVIEIASPRYQTWERYLSEEAGLDCETDPFVETVTCGLDDPSSVHVTVQQIELSLIL